MEQPIIHKTYTKITYREYRRFSNVLFIRRFIKISMLLAIGLILGLMPLIINYNANYANFLIDIALGCIIAAPVAFIINSIRVKQVYNSNKTLHNKEVELLFLKDTMEIKCQKSKDVIKYKDLYKIVETRANFYFMIAKNQGVIITKANCSQELIAFIKKLM